jgi:glycosyltransferase involved in cell wall biosynthesis
MEKAPYFSICVPTRNRFDTLEFCIKTLLHQDFENYEIIISDNSDVDNFDSKMVVENFNSTKIKYYKQSIVLSMTANYEFAVSKAIGEFIICIGDDDGIVINVLNRLYNFIHEYNCMVVKCPGIHYYWNNNNVTKYPKLIYPKSTAVKEFYSKSTLKKVFNLDYAYYHLPMIYYGCIHKSILEKIMQKQGSIFANAAAIDMYSGMCISYFTYKYIIPDFPFCIAGASAKSNGTNHHQKKKNSISNEFVKLGKIDYEYKKYNVPQVDEKTVSITWLCLNQFKHNFKLSNDEFNINIEKYLLELANTKDYNEELTTNDARLNIYNYQNILNKLNKDLTFRLVFYPKSISSNINYYDNHVELSSTLFELNNVYDASLLCEKITLASGEINTIAIDKNNYKKWKRTEKIKLIKQLIQKIIS